MLYSGGVGGPSGASFSGAIRGYDPSTDTWFFTRTNASPGLTVSTYHNIIEYSPAKNVAVYGGGNLQSSSLWRMDSAGTVVQMPDAPAGLNIGAGTGQGKFVNDPATGNFLLLSAGQLWELNPDGAGTWTQKTSPPSVVVNPNVGNGTVILSAISDYGVIAAISQSGSSMGTFCLYKNAPGITGLKPAIAASRRTIAYGPSIVYNVRGRVVARLKAGTQWNRAGAPAGVYFIRTRTNDHFVTRAMVVQ
jgi:hypothetical protein